MQTLSISYVALSPRRIITIKNASCSIDAGEFVNMVNNDVRLFLSQFGIIEVVISVIDVSTLEAPVIVFDQKFYSSKWKHSKK